MSSSLPSLPRPSDHFYDIVEVTNPPAMQVEPARSGEPSADALYGQEDMKTLFQNVVSGIAHQRTNFLKTWHAANSKPRKKDARFSRDLIEINHSESLSENISDRQEMPSIRLYRNLQKVTKFWWCDNFQVSRVEWRTNGGTWKKSGTYDWVRSMRSFTLSKKPFATRTLSRSEGGFHAGKSPSGKEDRLPCFSYKRGTVAMIESVIIGISRIAKKGKMWNGKGLFIHTSSEEETNC